MNLRNKLSRLSLFVPEPEPEPDFSSEDPRASRLASLRSQMDRLGKKLDRAPLPPAKRPFAAYDEDETFSGRVQAFAFTSSALPGEYSETADGPLRSVFTRLHDEHRHGSIPVTSA